MDDDQITKSDSLPNSDLVANDNQTIIQENVENQAEPISDPNTTQHENIENTDSNPVNKPKKSTPEPPPVETQSRPSPYPPPKTDNHVEVKPSSETSTTGESGSETSENAASLQIKAEVSTTRKNVLDYSSIDITKLSDEQLKSAAALWAKKNQKSLSQKGVQARRQTSQQNITKITEFISRHSPASNQTIARALNLPPRRVQHYMQILTKNGTVTATGWAQSRRYYKK